MNSVSYSNLRQLSYLTEEHEIRAFIDELTTKNILWLDTEVADYMTAHPRLSLIQVLSNSEDCTGNSTIILDVLDKPELISYFIDEIVTDAKIEKVFHNANYDLRFLGKESAKNISCTWTLAKKLVKKSLSVTDLKLKTLASELCHFVNIDREEQGSNWGRRPLTPKQLQYAKMDTVYLAHVHRRLIEIARSNSELTNNMSGSITENSSLSVTNVRVAFECPRLFYLGYRFGGMTLFLPVDTAIGIGTAFHDLSNQFINVAKQDSRFSALFEPVVEQLEVDAIAAALQQLLYERVFFPYLQASIQKDPGKAPALHQLWLGLVELIRRWAELLVSNRRYCTAKDVISKTFLAQELNVQHYFTLPNGTQQLVKGRCDSIVYDFATQRLRVVEYKSYQSVDQSAQLAQVALYSYMLRKTVGVKINSAVYSVLPNLQELSFTWEQLETTIHQLVPQKLQQMQQWLAWKPPQLNPPPPTSQPYLCHICPQQKKCQIFFDSDEAIAAERFKSPAPSPHTQDNQQLDSLNQDLEQHEAATFNIERTGEKLVETLQSFGLGVDYQGAAIGPAFVRVKIKPHAGIKVVSILRLANDLQVQLGITNPPLITPQAGYISVDLPRQDRQVASFADYVQSQVLPADAPVKVALGVNLERRLVEADLSDPNTCHFLVGGTTGSGKSEFLRSLLLSLVVRHSPDSLKVALVDPKRVTFPEFEQMRSLYSPVVKDTEQAIELMEQLVGEMEQRYQQFEAVGCADLTSYNQKTHSRLFRIVCIFDEYADFMAEKESRNALEQSIKRLGAMARAAGIHLIIATQRPEAKVVTPIIRSNLPGRIALRTASEADSAIILGGKQTSAAYLLGKGDLLYQNGAQLHRLQSLFAKTIQLG
ncbi:DNA translocase FtsK [Chroococcidiopsis sp. TS-821]|uniref:DNA translocase FtsK n=1 Tax=Chroococcidiopsis sp. TS-821 TaxID=1378066 RepID=UPI000CEF0792|nr:DNA translocase FtsK [Chroococcidiopsis sp. TS-821]PPS40338.1 cell division protein FtsK [Chroococcidiopsis sp. TS-821]